MNSGETPAKMVEVILHTTICSASHTVVNRYVCIIRTAWMDNIKLWTGHPVEESIRMTLDRGELRKYVHGVANPWIENG